MALSEKEQKYKWPIIVASVAIPALIAVLFGVRIDGVDLSILPPVYATINGLTAVALLAALIAIKKKNIKVHKRLMQLCIVFSLLFLGMYVAYHMTGPQIRFGDINGDGGDLSASEIAAAGSVRYIYLALLLVHILFSMIIIPLVLFTYVRALAERFDKHRKLARITFPIWLFVAVSGVIVYIMVAPYMDARWEHIRNNPTEQVSNETAP